MVLKDPQGLDQASGTAHISKMLIYSLSVCNDSFITLIS